MTHYWTLISWLIGAFIAALLLAVGHWFPWLQRPSGLRDYTYSAASLSIGFAAWRLLNADWITPLGLLAIAVIGGVTVKLASELDAWILAIRKAKKAERHDDYLQ